MTELNVNEFNSDFYRQVHADVDAKIQEPGETMTARVHYDIFGIKEGRISNLSWDEVSYLENNPDVAAQVANGNVLSGLVHYSTLGINDGRQGYYNIDFDSALDSEGYYNTGFDSFLEGNDLTLLWGNHLNDALSGNELGNHLRGAAGDDILYGYGGDDVVYGHSENDVLYGGSGNDVLFGDDSTPQGSDGNDKLYGEGGDDELTGGGGFDLLVGGTGKDTLRGNDGNDKLYGNEDWDEIFGGAGDDLIKGGSGKDVLKGQSGNDTYVFRAGDFWDIISDEGDSTGDAVFFDASINFEDVTFEKVTGKAHIDVVTGGVGDRVRVINQLAPFDTNRIETFNFNNDVILTAEDVSGMFA